jgi:hypothetical protein
VSKSKDRYKSFADSISAQDYGAQVILRPFSIDNGAHGMAGFSKGINLTELNKKVAPWA